MRCDALKAPVLCLVTDRMACLGRSLESVVADALAAGITLVQLREKDLPPGRLLELGRKLMEPVRAAGGALVVNDRVDVALALGADGVHLGRGSLPVPEARRLMGNAALIGASVHTRAEAANAEAEGADYLVLGTIFPSRSHPDTPGAGPGLVAEVTSTVRLPVIAIGGITPANARSVMEAGAWGVAVITAIQSAQDVRSATGALLSSVRQGAAFRAMTGVAKSVDTR
jgi:thiamine-phosphate pyrophosphorylase